jgi:hypothetical protein
VSDPILDAEDLNEAEKIILSHVAAVFRVLLIELSKGVVTPGFQVPITAAILTNAFYKAEGNRFAAMQSEEASTVHQAIALAIQNAQKATDEPARIVTEAVRTFQCAVCKEEFSQELAIREHIKAKHGIEPSWRLTPTVKSREN